MGEWSCANPSRDDVASADSGCPTLPPEPFAVRFIARLRPAVIATTTLPTLISAPPSPGTAQATLTRRDTGVINRSANPLLSAFRFRSIGPASMGGRIDDIAVYEKDPRIIWV